MQRQTATADRFTILAPRNSFLLVVPILPRKCEIRECHCGKPILSFGSHCKHYVICHDDCSDLSSYSSRIMTNSVYVTQQRHPERQQCNFTQRNPTRMGGLFVEKNSKFRCRKIDWSFIHRSGSVSHPFALHEIVLGCCCH